MGSAAEQTSPEREVYNGTGTSDEATLELYKLYVEMMDRTSIRRQEANKFFLTALSLLAVLYPILDQVGGAGLSAFWRYTVPVIATAMCGSWLLLLRSYRQFNAGKFAVIHEIEARLPVQPYSSEWSFLGEGRTWRTYLPLGSVESTIPWLFLIVHAILALLAFGLAG